jgi:hypothetical protein
METVRGVVRRALVQEKFRDDKKSSSCLNTWQAFKVSLQLPSCQSLSASVVVAVKTHRIGKEAASQDTSRANSDEN